MATLHVLKKIMALFESKEISNFQTVLNSVENAPSRGYRRNVTVYTLVCYVNNITGCYLSKNSEPIPVFIGRARGHMQDYPPGEVWGNYYELVTKYLNMVESHLESYGIDTTYL